MYQDKAALYLDDHFKLDRDFGPNIDVGHVMTTNIIKRNGHVLHRFKYQALTKDEWDKEE